MKKQTKTVAMMIAKVWQLHDMIARIDRYVIQHNVGGAMCVTFHHNAERKLIGTRWSDQYYDCDNALSRETYCEYSYEVTSKGISFRGYSTHEFKNGWSQCLTHWSNSGDDNTISLLNIPNNPPPDYKGTMYLFHQEKIRETLSILPAWAIACMYPQ
jgi:hypothetical protein